MSIVKSFSVGNGDTFYIKHGSDNFTMIDCKIDEDTDYIIKEIIRESKSKGIHRFISTHPDEDHIHGIEQLDKRWSITNFYCVKNEVYKEDITPSFRHYCKLRDNKDTYYLSKGCKRKWLNMSSDSDEEENRKSSGISILWPDVDNNDFRKELEDVKNGKSPNNISPILVYRGGAKFMWMGDLETEFLEKVVDEIDLEEVDVLFAPHHGRESGAIPEVILHKINPQIIVIGEAPSDKLHYYNTYNTITQNSAKDIIFDVSSKNVDLYVGNSSYSVDFLSNHNRNRFENYIGSFISR